MPENHHKDTFACQWVLKLPFTWLTEQGERNKSPGVPRRGWCSRRWSEEREDKSKGKTGRRKEWEIKWKVRRTYGSYRLKIVIWVTAGIL